MLLTALTPDVLVRAGELWAEGLMISRGDTRCLLVSMGLGSSPRKRDQGPI